MQNKQQHNFFGLAEDFVCRIELLQGWFYPRQTNEHMAQICIDFFEVVQQHDEQNFQPVRSCDILHTVS